MQLIKDKVMIIGIIIISAIIGGVISYNTIPIADKCQILYVSQDEIMELEKARIADSKLEQKELFFGKVEEAVKLVTTLPSNYARREAKIIYAVGKISGKNVQSISRKIHQDIIKKLSQ